MNMKFAVLLIFAIFADAAAPTTPLTIQLKPGQAVSESVAVGFAPTAVTVIAACPTNEDKTICYQLPTGGMNANTITFRGKMPTSGISLNVNGASGSPFVVHFQANSAVVAPGETKQLKLKVGSVVKQDILFGFGVKTVVPGEACPTAAGANVDSICHNFTVDARTVGFGGKMPSKSVDIKVSGDSAIEAATIKFVAGANAHFASVAVAMILTLLAKIVSL